MHILAQAAADVYVKPLVGKKVPDRHTQCGPVDLRAVPPIPLALLDGGRKAVRGHGHVGEQEPAQLVVPEVVGQVEDLAMERVDQPAAKLAGDRLVRVEAQGNKLLAVETLVDFWSTPQHQ